MDADTAETAIHAAIISHRRRHFYEILVCGEEDLRLLEPIRRREAIEEKFLCQPPEAERVARWYGPAAFVGIFVHEEKPATVEWELCFL